LNNKIKYLLNKFAIWLKKKTELIEYDESNMPLFVKLGKNGTALRLKLNYLDKLVYYRDGGRNGKISIMDIDSEEFWQSELQEPAMMQGGK
jgi:hypothetical protein